MPAWSAIAAAFRGQRPCSASAPTHRAAPKAHSDVTRKYQFERLGAAHPAALRLPHLPGAGGHRPKARYPGTLLTTLLEGGAVARRRQPTAHRSRTPCYRLPTSMCHVSHDTDVEGSLPNAPRLRRGSRRISRRSASATSRAAVRRAPEPSSSVSRPLERLARVLAGVPRGTCPPTASATDARCPSVRLCARQVRKGFPRRLRRHGGLPSEPCSGFHSRAGRVGAYAFFGVSPCCFFVPSLAARRPTDRTRTLDRMTHVGSIFGPSKSIPAGSSTSLGPTRVCRVCVGWRFLRRPSDRASRRWSNRRGLRRRSAVCAARSKRLEIISARATAARRWTPLRPDSRWSLAQSRSSSKTLTRLVPPPTGWTPQPSRERGKPRSGWSSP